MGNVKKILFVINLLILTSISACVKNDIPEYTLELYASTGGISEGQGKFIEGSSVTAVAMANENFEFSNWREYYSGEIVSTDASYAFSITKNISLIAYFTEASEKIMMVSESENIDMPIIPNYGTNVPKDKFQILTRYIGDLFINEGISQDKSGVVNQDGNTQAVINTHDLEQRGIYEPIVGGGPHIWMSKRPSDELRFNPWADNEKLVLQMNAAVPLVALTDKDGNTANSGFTANQAPVTQLSFGFYLYDESSKKTFAYIIPVYESRGTYQESANNSDTFVSFVSSPLEESSEYITKSPESARLQSTPFSEKKFFKVSLTRENLLKGINDTNADMSTDLSNYQVTFIGVLFELPNYVKDGHNISMVDISDFSVYIQ